MFQRVFQPLIPEVRLKELQTDLLKEIQRQLQRVRRREVLIKFQR